MKPSKLLANASLRRPFIVTVSAAAAITAAACGGSTGGEIEGTAPSEVVGTSNPPPASDCPAAQPSNGDPCDVDSSNACGYQDCFGSPAVTAKCTADGTWSVVERSCNPPQPPPPPPAACPDAEPTRPY